MKKCALVHHRMLQVKKTVYSFLEILTLFCMHQRTLAISLKDLLLPALLSPFSFLFSLVMLFYFCCCIFIYVFIFIIDIKNYKFSLTSLLSVDELTGSTIIPLIPHIAGLLVCFFRSLMTFYLSYLLFTLFLCYKQSFKGFPNLLFSLNNAICCVVGYNLVKRILRKCHYRANK